MKDKLKKHIKKYGFTLIEVLAVLVIITIIGLIAIPNVSKIISTSKEKATVEHLKTISRTASTYYRKQQLLGNISIEVDLLDDKIKYDGEKVEKGKVYYDWYGDSYIIMYYKGYCLSKDYRDNISYHKTTINECNIDEPLHPSDPVISLIGDAEIRLKQNEIYIEYGAEAKTVDETLLIYTREIMLNDTVVESINTTQYGREYMVIYKVSSNGKKAQVTRNVLIIDGIAPVVTVPAETTINVSEVAGYDLMTGVIVTDNSGISPTITITGNLSTIPGDYTITYKAVDTEGNETIKTRIIKVIEIEAPILNFSSTSTNQKWVKNITVTITATDNNNISSFTYEIIKNEVNQGIQNVTVNGKNASKEIVLNTDGKYKIRISAKDEYNNESDITSGEYKIDTIPPELTLNDTILNGNEVENYDLMTGVTTTDNSGTIPTITYTGSLSVVSGDYTITYTATDEAGNSITKTRKITVNAKTCTEGTLTYDSTYGDICVKNATGSTSCGTCWRLEPYTSASCENCGVKTCATCNYYDDNGNVVNGANCSKCGISECNTCTYNALVGYIDCSCGSTTTYSCPSGWSNYTGSGSSLKCYKLATQ